MQKILSTFIAICLIGSSVLFAPSALAADTTDYSSRAYPKATRSTDLWSTSVGAKSTAKLEDNVSLFTGGAKYDYPLALPRGRSQATTPDLDLSYFSYTRRYDSLVGYGWSLPTNAIYRSSVHGGDKLYAEDVYTADIFGSTEDLIVRDAATQKYSPKIEGSFRTYQKSGTGWVATDTRGTRYFFGTTTASQQADPTLTTKIYKWALDRIEDTNGNFVTFTYAADSGQLYPDTIRYSGHDSNAGLYEIRFIRELRTNPATSYVTGFRVDTKYRIKSVDLYLYTTGTAALARRYSLTYGATDTIIETLTGITLAGGTTSMPATQFTYYAGTENTGRTRNLLKSVMLPTGGTIDFTYKSTITYRTQAGDLQNAKLPFILQTLQALTYKASSTDTPYVMSYAYAGAQYYSNSLDAYKREYAGFHDVTVTEPNGVRTIHSFHQSQTSADNAVSAAAGEYADHIAKKGQEYRTEVRDATGNLYDVEIRRWDMATLPDADPTEERIYPFLARTTKLSYDGNSDAKATATSYTYDAYGNPAIITDYGEVTPTGNAGDFTDSGTDKLVTTRTYAVNTSATIVSLPREEVVQDQGGATVRDTRYTYDTLPVGQVTLGNLTKVEQLVSGTTFAVTETAYDAYGLPTTTTNPRGYATTIAYDTHHLFPATITNTKNQTTTYAYDYATGTPTSVTDPNGAKTLTTLDGLGRPTTVAVSNPASPASAITQTTYAYDLTSRPTSVTTQSYTDATTDTLQATYFDGFGRQIQSRIESENNQFVVTSRTYDNRGLVARELLPTFGSGSSFTAIDTGLPGTTYTYDPLKRVLTAVTPLGTTTTSYDQWSRTVTDPLNHRKTYTTDARVNLVSVTEFIGSTPYVTSYAYDANRNLTQVTDSSGNLRHTTYDTLGHKLTDEDLHSSGASTFGVRTYTYDLAGNLLTSLDPKGQTVTRTYDELDRLLTENPSTGSGQIAYTYDTATNGIGKVATITNTNNQLTTYTYDILGRITTENKTIAGTSYATTSTYDLRGQPISITYPDSTTVTYGYDSASLLDTVNLGSTPIVTSLTYAPTGSYATIAYGSGAVTTNTYDTARGYRLATRVTTTGSTNLQNLAYTYDAVSNITRIVDTSTTQSAKTTDYTYDDLDRLTSATVTNASDSNNYTQTYTYDAIGNMTNRSDVGAYAYAGAHPHAVTSISPPILGGAGGGSYTYDANGNLVTNTTWTHTYNYQDRLTSSTDGAQTINYTYDNTGIRVTKENITTGKQSSYVSKYYEILNGEIQRHIYAGDLKVATLTDTIEYPACVLPTVPLDPETQQPIPQTWTPTESCLFTGALTSVPDVTVNLPSGAVTLPQENNQILIKLAGDARTRLIYHHADHLTGASVETDDTGTAIEVTDYYPYGSERLNSKVGRYNTPHKFTGKELDTDTGLYDYGARYYDPVLSRFLSIDPWSGNLEDPQSLNKYSYTKNNPVKYVDPTGKNPLLAAMAVGAVGGAVWGAGIDVGIQLYQTGTVNWGQVGTSAIAGAAVGAVLGPIGEAVAPALSRAVSGMIRGAFGEAEGTAAAGVKRVGEEATRAMDPFGKKLEEQLIKGELRSQDGIPIAGKGTEVPINQIDKITKQFGGKSEDWSKMTSDVHKLPDGTKVQSHWYENISTGQKVLPKEKITPPK